MRHDLKGTEPRRGSIAKLAQGKLKTWRGWVIYLWDMGYSAALFKKKPKADPDIGGWDFSKAIEGISPYFLRACGINVRFDVMGHKGRMFYYGGRNSSGQHPPMRIELTLPKALLDQLNL